MNADGSDIVRLTSDPAADTHPGWSPDAARIVFESSRSGDSEIYSMREDGSDVVRLTHQARSDADPAWSPDGKRIAFASNRGGYSEIYTMRPNGTDIRRLTTSDTLWMEEHSDPEWSPDGKTIIYDRWDPDRFDAIYAVDVSTGDQRVLDLQPGDRFDGVFAPDPASPATNGIVYSWSSYTVLESSDLFVRSITAGALPVQLTDTDEVSEYQADWQPVPAFPLVDARFSSFALEIEWLYGEGITRGCAAERFCPGDSLTRGQMASLLVRALDLPSSPVDAFSDDDGSTHEPDIDALAAAGVTAGCGGGRYCPAGVVTRAEMASFLVRALDLPQTTTDWFTDDDTNTHEAEINALATSGITAGCGGGRYCPKAPVTRGQIAAFLYRALKTEP